MITDIRVGIPLIGGESWLGGVSHMELHRKLSGLNYSY